MEQPGAAVVIEELEGAKVVAIVPLEALIDPGHNPHP